MVTRGKKTSKKKSKKPDFPKRDILWTPWRFEYIKGGVQEKGPGDCVLCHAIKKGSSFESLVLDMTDHAATILNKYPYNNGHLMVIPRQHTNDLADLSKVAFDNLQEQMLRAYKIIKDEYKPQGLNIGLNLGRIGGAGIVDHLHYHILPRWGGDTNFMPLLAGTKVISETLEQTYQRLIPYFK